MRHERFANRSGAIPDLAYARGAGSREQGGRSRDVGRHALVTHQCPVAFLAIQPQPMHGGSAAEELS